MGIKRTYVMPLLVLTLICIVVSIALALMDNITYPVIRSAAERRAQAAMIEKIPEATGFTEIEIELYNRIPSTIKEIYETENEVGYIFIAAVNGFSGDITIICAVNPDGRIIAVSTLSHTETKGIGTIIEQESFLDKFNGLDKKLDGVDTVVGATVTTRAFIKAIDDILAAFEIVKS
ncbi:MAG: FMN-binding protein [Oscillospiraceae bacterium]|jgi:electron transport complex protein RnfG|nr:FMN-binding protein [Oscillospiraceae bacterium]